MQEMWVLSLIWEDPLEKKTQEEEEEEKHEYKNKYSIQFSSVQSLSRV